MTHFDSQRDKEVIDNGGFFCQACLTGKPLDDKSPDPRYCLVCHEFLSNEVELLPDKKHKKPSWVPVSGWVKTEPAPVEVVPKPPIVSSNGSVVLSHPGGRPRKQGDISKRTEYRRKKELQGVLL